MSSTSQTGYSVFDNMDDYFSTLPRIDQYEEAPFQTLHNILATNPAADYFYARSLSDSSGSTSSEISPQDLQSDRRKDKRDKRRAQNRIAQRAYRERKEQIRHELEVKVKLWQEEHEALRKSYHEQSQEVDRLKGHIEKLLKQLTALRDYSGTDDNSSSGFDLWPYVQWQEIEGIGEP